ncbi:MAG: ATP-dependent Clp protease ATP-binding subunit ClpC, partial [Candidatus Hydrogenedentes bacterium]|nr:ATP-dependent Clp protease ATP-binding subunit ClpC [Candidatus Hydrogenedentota bacterium]
MQVHVSPEISSVLDAAARNSVRNGQYFVGVEHLFDVLVEEAHRLPRSVTEQYGKALQTVAREVAREAWRSPAPSANGEVFYTPRCANTLNEAARLAERFRTGQPKAGHLLMAIVADAHAAPSRAMDRVKLDRGALLQLLQQELAGKAAGGGAPAGAPQRNAAQAADAQAAPKAEAEPETAPASLESLTHDLTQAALDGKLEPAIGRDHEIFEMMQVLARKTKNNVILVGEAGVGKTKVVEGLALNTIKGGTMDELFSGFRV